MAALDPTLLDPTLTVEYFEALGKWNPRYVRYAEANGHTPEDQAAADARAYPGGKNTGFILWINEAWTAWSALRGRDRNAFKSDADHADFDLWLVKRSQYSRYRERHTIDPITTADHRGQGIAGGYYTCRHDGLRVYRRAIPGGWAHADEGVRALRHEANPVGWPK